MTITLYYLRCPSCEKAFGINKATKLDHDPKFSCIHCGETLPRKHFECIGSRNGQENDVHEFDNLLRWRGKKI